MCNIFLLLFSAGCNTWIDDTNIVAWRGNGSESMSSFSVCIFLINLNGKQIIMLSVERKYCTNLELEKWFIPLERAKFSECIVIYLMENNRMCYVGSFGWCSCIKNGNLDRVSHNCILMFQYFSITKNNE